MDKEFDAEFDVEVRREQVLKVRIVASRDSSDDALAIRAIRKAKPEDWKNDAMPYFDCTAELVEELDEP